MVLCFTWNNAFADLGHLFKETLLKELRANGIPAVRKR